MILHETRQVQTAIDRYSQLVNPSGQYALDMALPKRESIVVPRRKVADVQLGPLETDDLRRFPLREEPIDDTSLVEDLDGARVYTERTRAGSL